MERERSIVGPPEECIEVDDADTNNQVNIEQTTERAHKDKALQRLNLQSKKSN